MEKYELNQNYSHSDLLHTGFSDVPIPLLTVRNTFPNSYRNEYIRLGLIDLEPWRADTILKGTVHLMNLINRVNADTVFFLTRSGASAAFIFCEMWQNLIPYIPLPDIQFIDIGREQYSLDRAFSPRVAHSLSTFYPNQRNKTIVVADEHVDTGETLQRAAWIINKVFPEAQHIIPTGMYQHAVPPPWRDLCDEPQIDHSVGKFWLDTVAGRKADVDPMVVAKAFLPRFAPMTTSMFGQLEILRTNTRIMATYVECK